MRPSILSKCLVVVSTLGGVMARAGGGPSPADITAMRVAFLESAYHTTVNPTAVTDISSPAISALSKSLAVKGQPEGLRQPTFRVADAGPTGDGEVSAEKRAGILRNQAYAAAAYCFQWLFNKKWTCNERCTNGMTDSTVMVDYFNKDSTTGYIAYNDVSKQIIISFRGSLFPLNFYRDLQLDTTDLTIGASTAPAGTKVHIGFQQTYLIAQDHVRQVVASIRTDPTRESYTITVVGHSLGGAVAVLAALDMKEFFGDARVEVWTYGEPRVGNEIFARWVNTLDIPITRVTAQHDPIPTIPRRDWGSLDYMHHHDENYVTGNRSVIVSCLEPSDGDEPTDCLNGEPDLAARDVASVLTPIWIVWHLNTYSSDIVFGPWC